MEYSAQSQSSPCDYRFAADVRRECGVHVERCYQCLTCTLGCEAAYAMDVKPHQIVRLTQLGLKDALLGCRAIWVCTHCENCVARCPNEIDIPHLIDALHQQARREGYPVPEPGVPVFHSAFLAPLRTFSRQFEVLMTGLFMLWAKKFSPADLLANARLGFKMFTRGKLKFMPPGVKDRGAVKRIFEKTIDAGKNK